jgi:hypothetical protein
MTLKMWLCPLYKKIIKKEKAKSHIDNGFFFFLDQMIMAIDQPPYEDP